MNKTSTICLTLLLGAYASNASAAPGEWWEITSKTEMPGMPFKMPETTVRACVEKDAATDPRQTMQDKDCKMTDIKTSGNKTTWKMRCVRNGEVMNGNGEFVGNADGYKGVTRLKGTAGGQPINMTSSYRGKRVGPKCDSVKDNKLGGAAGKSPSDAEKQSESATESMKKLKGMFGL
ncbi:MAG: hypothetical protein A2063_04070 [Gallionellales bacterium GWA2_60_142]|nr:MAG: hypothetical protein A2063_04070 [Gallionellales bacterium GWA2_60_142]HCI14593.1 hypothetical protein [Gallionellaceae bacterium]